MQNAMSNGNYALAQEALRKANNIKPVQNYQSLSNSMDALNNYSMTGSTLNLVEQQKLELYGKLATTGAQIIGDWVKHARERKEREAQEKKAEEQRMIALKTPIYFSELAKSQTNVLYEKETVLQNALIEAYNAPIGQINFDVIFSFGAKLFVPQQIKLPGLIIKSYADKVTYIKDGREQTLTGDNVNGPKLFLNPSKSKMLVAYFTSAGTDGKIALQVYDLGGMRKMGNSILFETNKEIPNQPLGFGLSEDEIVFTEYIPKSISSYFEIVVYNYSIGREVKRIKSERLPVGIRENFQFNRIINGRFAMGISDFKDFYKLVDLQSEKSVILPRLLFNDCINNGLAKSDTILALLGTADGIVNYAFTLNYLNNLFTKDVIKQFTKDKIQSDFRTKFAKNLYGGVVNGFFVD
ncbi:MAG: hypothetical protein NTZ59_13210, partial [Bacteroidetes bacterium]|nr:hypothetical protein [Bacteroidota bacterium]